MRSNAPPRLTIAAARALLNPIGLVLVHNPDYGEYRVNYRAGREATAYYTNDLADALATGQFMATFRTGGVQ